MTDTQLKESAKVPWLVLIVICSMVSIYFGVRLAESHTPKPSPQEGERCDNYCQGVSRGGSMVWDKYGYACLCGYMQPKQWDYEGPALLKVIPPSADAGGPE